MTDNDNKNIGELADDNLAALSNLEELLDDLDRNQKGIQRWRLKEAREQLETAQDNSVEILRRFEEQVGPI